MRKFILFFFLSPLLLQAQGTDANYERDYKSAVSLYKSGDYTAALRSLTPLTAAKYQNGLTPFAHYYWALASLKTNRFGESRQMLHQLRERFPDWKKMDDVLYLQADLAFRDKQFGQALDYLQDITSAVVKKDAENLKKVYVNQVQDLAYLKNLYRQHPSDRVVAQKIIDLIQQTSNDKADLELSDQLTNRFGIVPAKTTSSVNPIKKGQNNLQKGYYNIGVALPFKLREFSPSQRFRNNQFAYDMYEGMKMAKAKLQQEGILVSLFSYDVGSEPEEMLDVVNNTNFAQTDLLFGPVYSEPAKLAADYADNNNIFFIHPTTLTTDILTNHPNTLLLQPSFERQADKSFEFMRSLPASMGRKVAIYYGSARRDSVLAAAYKSKVDAAGYQTVDFRKTREKIDSAATISEANKPSHVAVFSSSEGDGTKVLAMLTKKRLKPPVLTTSTSFNLQTFQPALIEGHTVYWLDTEFVDITKPQVREFQTLYFNKRNTIPSIYAMQGYDALLFFGRMLHKYRNQLRNGLETRTYEDDYLLSGFNYRNSSDNQVVPILTLDDMHWVPAK
ncbi:ABC transporter substrate-binding protein [Runella sp. MFBS21]|uniref:ABC transporter substrate-binding protein n=1 Tax=Runella sp. MFBS21 TaxID=3034018 RepID=UPI0023F9777A|nr:ABC transporter substrate-binding protein [Runella sp. MFBS21]MDF7818441.1 ABC transporter substrate-binding protein [Runella sp. MFBS21]